MSTFCHCQMLISQAAIKLRKTFHYTFAQFTFHINQRPLLFAFRTWMPEDDSWVLILRIAEKLRSADTEATRALSRPIWTKPVDLWSTLHCRQLISNVELGFWNMFLATIICECCNSMFTFNSGWHFSAYLTIHQKKDCTHGLKARSAFSTASLHVKLYFSCHRINNFKVAQPKLCAYIGVVGDFTVLTYPVPDMTTDDAAVDAERTGRLADSHTGIPLADAWLIARIHMTSSASFVRLSCSVWDTLSSKRRQVRLFGV